MVYREEKDISKEALEYLELRQRLKAAIRTEMRKESCTVLGQSHQINKLHRDNYGSFFGPSETVIARRVIQQNKALPEIQHSTKKKKTRLAGMETTIGLLDQKMKAQMLRETRDYSFLFSIDAEIRKESPPERVSKPSPGACAAKLSMSSNSGKALNEVDERKHVTTAPHSQPGSWPNDLCSTNPRKQLGSSNPNVICRPAVQKFSPDKATRKSPIASGINASLTKYDCSDVHKASFPKFPSVKKQHVELKREFECPDKAKTRQNQLQPSPKHQRKRMFREDSDEDDCDVSSIITRLFRRNHRTFVVEDNDDSVMESSFADILKEERRSAIAARKEDERERLQIEEEERKERFRKAKKLKLTRHY